MSAVNWHRAPLCNYLLLREREREGDTVFKKIEHYKVGYLGVIIS